MQRLNQGNLLDDAASVTAVTEGKKWSGVEKTDSNVQIGWVETGVDDSDEHLKRQFHDGRIRRLGDTFRCSRSSER